MIISIPNISEIILVIRILAVGDIYICKALAAVYHEKGLLMTAYPKPLIHENMPIPVLPTSMLHYTDTYPCKKKMIIMINLF
jgi:hypothetical protein